MKTVAVSDKITLKSCPFCGGEAEIIEHKYAGASDTYGCRCMKCNSQSYQFYEQLNKAIEAWNRRAEDECIN